MKLSKQEYISSKPNVDISTLRKASFYENPVPIERLEHITYIPMNMQIELVQRRCIFGLDNLFFILNRNWITKYKMMHKGDRLRNGGYVYRQTPVPYTSKYKNTPYNKIKGALLQELRHNDITSEYEDEYNVKIIRNKRKETIELVNDDWDFYNDRARNGVKNWKRTKKRKQWM